MSKWDTDQETTETAEREMHEEGMCDGAPECGYCLDERAAAKQEEKAKQRQRDNEAIAWGFRMLKRIDEERAA